MKTNILKYLIFGLIACTTLCCRRSLWKLFCQLTDGSTELTVIGIPVVLIHENHSPGTQWSTIFEILNSTLSKQNYFTYLIRHLLKTKLVDRARLYYSVLTTIVWHFVCLSVCLYNENGWPISIKFGIKAKLQLRNNFIFYLCFNILFSKLDCSRKLFSFVHPKQFILSKFNSGINNECIVF